MSLRSGPPSASIAPLAGLVLCLALWPSTTHAQYIGIKGGLSVANVNVTGRPHLPAELQWCCSPWDGTRLDPAVGVMAGVTIRPSIELTMETLLTQRGFSIDRTDADPGSQLRMSYIELAVLGVLLSPRCPAPSPEEQAVTAAIPRKVTDATSARARGVMGPSYAYGASRSRQRRPRPPH